jgi:hypothetical protein
MCVYWYRYIVSIHCVHSCNFLYYIKRGGLSESYSHFLVKQRGKNTCVCILWKDIFDRTLTCWSVPLQQKIAAVGISLRRHLGPLPADIFGPRHGASFFLMTWPQIAGYCAYSTVHLTFHPFSVYRIAWRKDRNIALWELQVQAHLFGLQRRRKLFWEITRILYIAYTFCDLHSRLQCVYRKERPYRCIESKKFAAACLALRTRTVASFWTVACKFQDADVHWHPLQVYTLGRSDSPSLRGGREISPSHRTFVYI